MARSSLLQDLRLSFSLATFLLAGAMALGTALAMHQSLESEDAAVLSSQGRAVLESIRAGTATDQLPVTTLESVRWRLVGPGGTILKRGAGSGDLDALAWPSRTEDPVELEVQGRLWSLTVLDAPEGQLQLAMDRSHEEDLLARFHRILLLSLLLAAAGSAAVGHLVAKRGLRSLERIQEETSRIEARDLDRRLAAEDFPAELGRLVDTLNAALGRLHDAFLRLEHLAGDMAHELRTPLQNLRLELEGLVLRPKDADAQREQLGSVLEELDRLGAMVEQMLFLARSGVPGAELDRKELEAGDSLRDAAAFFSAAAEEAGVRLEVAVPEGLRVSADPGLLQRALQNLLANAIRHTPKGGHVRLSAAPVDQGTEIQVEDDGEGFPAELLPRLGQRFARAESSRDRRRGGAGLGLAIVRGIMELHGGTFRVDGQPRQGASLRLWFPDPRFRNGPSA